jgi:DNA-binding transcriptional ArsR family regulator
LFAVTDVFDALSAESRRLILDELTERDGQALYELCTRLMMRRGLSLTRQAISQHLDVLEAAGLVRTVREGRYKFHYIETGPLERAVRRWSKSNKEGG